MTLSTQEYPGWHLFVKFERWIMPSLFFQCSIHLNTYT